MGSAGFRYENAVWRDPPGDPQEARINRQMWPIRPDVSAGVLEHVEGWYNPTGGSPHSPILSTRVPPAARRRQQLRLEPAIADDGSVASIAPTAFRGPNNASRLDGRRRLHSPDRVLARAVSLCDRLGSGRPTPAHTTQPTPALAPYGQKASSLIRTTTTGKTYRPNRGGPPRRTAQSPRLGLTVTYTALALGDRASADPEQRIPDITER